MRTLLLLTGLLAANFLPAQDNVFGPAIATNLERVRADPEAYRGVKITFVVQFASLGKLSNPFFTRFTPSEYVNFYAWGDEQPIWRKESYENLFGMLFLSKMHARTADLYATRLYQRMRVTGVVRNTFQDQPWIEVLDFERVAGQVDVAVLSHLHRGEQFMAARRWQRAIAELSMAPGPGVPEPVLFAIHKNLGVSYLRMGEAHNAVTHLQQAATYSTEPDMEVQRLLAAAETRPSQELDRQVSMATLREFERPMWEAFDRGSKAAPQTSTGNR